MKNFIKKLNNTSFKDACIYWVVVCLATILSTFSYVMCGMDFATISLINIAMTFLFVTSEKIYYKFIKKSTEIHHNNDGYTILRKLIIFIFVFMAFGPYIWAIIFTATYPSFKFVKKCRYRGYYLPTKNNKILHVKRVLSGELGNGPIPEDWP